MAPQLFTTAQEGIAAEVAMLERAAVTGRAAHMLWRAERQAVVLPAANLRRPGFAGAAMMAARAGWPLVARPSGGGAVPQGLGILNLALCFPAAEALTPDAAYRQLCAPIIAAFGSFGLELAPGETAGSFCDGAWNLSYRGQKLVGTAQRWRSGPTGQTILAHALILIDPPLGPAVSVIDRLHRALDLGPPVIRGAHTTLRALCPHLGEADFIRALAAQLQQSALCTEEVQAA